jgi:hypothetical protein
MVGKTSFAADKRDRPHEYEIPDIDFLFLPEDQFSTKLPKQPAGNYLDER